MSTEHPCQRMRRRCHYLISHDTVNVLLHMLRSQDARHCPCSGTAGIPDLLEQVKAVQIWISLTHGCFIHHRSSKSF